MNIGSDVSVISYLAEDCSFKFFYFLVDAGFPLQRENKEIKKMVKSFSDRENTGNLTIFAKHREFKNWIWPWVNEENKIGSMSSMIYIWSYKSYHFIAKYTEKQNKISQGKHGEMQGILLSVTSGNYDSCLWPNFNLCWGHLLNYY